jgi:hypothetical protein
MKKVLLVVVLAVAFLAGSLIVPTDPTDRLAVDKVKEKKYLAIQKA